MGMEYIREGIQGSSSTHHSIQLHAAEFLRAVCWKLDRPAEVGDGHFEDGPVDWSLGREVVHSKEGPFCILQGLEIAA